MRGTTAIVAGIVALPPVRAPVVGALPTLRPSHRPSHGTDILLEGEDAMCAAFARFVREDLGQLAPA